MYVRTYAYIYICICNQPNPRHVYVGYCRTTSNVSGGKNNKAQTKTHFA